MPSIQAVVLAAGRSSRFNTGKSKLLEKICGREMLLYPLDHFVALSIPTTFVVGYQKEAIKQIIEQNYPGFVSYIEQTELRGSGHAIMCSEPVWQQDHVLVINGDCPLVSRELLQTVIDRHHASGAAMTFVTSHNVDPRIGAYGKVLEENNILQVVEASDFKGDPTIDYPINAGIYLLKRSFLQEFINQLPINLPRNEFYFVDIIRLGSEAGYKIITVDAPFDLVRGVNTLRELWVAEQLKRSELIGYWMDRGVRFHAAQNIHLDLGVQLAPGCHIGAGVQLFGNTTIGKNSIIGAYSIITDATIGENVTVHPHSVITTSTISTDAMIGPFAHIHGQSVIADNASIGNFVELEGATIAQQGRIARHSYITPADVSQPLYRAAKLGNDEPSSPAP